MKIARYSIASIAIAVTLIAGCAMAPGKKDAGEDAEIKRRMAEFDKAVQMANEKRARDARADSEQRAKQERSSAATADAKQRAKPEHAGAGSGLTPDQRDVSTAIANWLAAWSRKDVKGYLAAYAKDFAVPRGRSRRQWEAERRARIVGKSWIDVKIEALEITIDGNIARTRFRQNYRSDKLTETGNKTLMLIRTNQQWLIQREEQ